MATRQSGEITDLKGLEKGMQNAVRNLQPLEWIVERPSVGGKLASLTLIALGAYTLLRAAGRIVC